MLICLEYINTVKRSFSVLVTSILRFLYTYLMCLFFLICIPYMCVLPACMFVHHMCAWCPWRSEEDPLELELQVVMRTM